MIPFGLGMIGSAATTTTYSSTKSLRFDGTSYMRRSISSSNNLDLWGFSVWLKRSAFGSRQDVFMSYDSGPYSLIGFDDSDHLQFLDSNIYGGSACMITTAVYRDPTAWMHVLFVYDSGNATSGDRWRLYVNGERVTSFITAVYPAQGIDSYMGYTGLTQGLGIAGGYGAYYYFGYMDDACFITNQALDQYDFGEFNASTGQWNPIDLSGLTPGTNGGWWQFENSTSTTTLGEDSLGSNDWTTITGFSIASGSGNDSLEDTCTNNYCTLDPGFLNTWATCSNGMLNYGSSDAGTGWQATNYGTIPITSGKWYWEGSPTAGSYWFFGIAQQDDPLEEQNHFPGKGSVSAGYYISNGLLYQNASGSAFGDSAGIGDTISIAFDADNGKIWFAKNGVWQASGDPATGANPALSNCSGRVFYPAVSVQFSAASGVINFGQRDFSHTPPTGFKTLCSANQAFPSGYHFVPIGSATIPQVNLANKAALRSSSTAPITLTIYPRTISGWNNATILPHYLYFTWAYTATINTIWLINNYGTNYTGDLKVEYWNGGAWVEFVNVNITTLWLTNCLKIDANSIETTQLRITLINSGSGNEVDLTQIQIIGTGGSDCTIEAQTSLYTAVDNLARHTSSVVGPDGAITTLNDGNVSNYWQTTSKPYYVELTWSTEQTVKTIEILDYYYGSYGVEGWKVSYWNGSGWVVITNYCQSSYSVRIILDSAILTTKLRVEALDGASWVVLSEIQVFST